MGIFDFIKDLFSTKDTGGKSPKSLMSEAKQAADQQNFNMASIKMYYALEQMGESYLAKNREPNVTAREYAESLTEDGIVSQEELEPIIVNFEVAKYSEMEVSADDYTTAEEALSTSGEKLRKGRSKAKKSKRRRRRRRRPRRGGRTGAARKRERKKR